MILAVAPQEIDQGLHAFAIPPCFGKGEIDNRLLMRDQGFEGGSICGWRNMQQIGHLLDVGGVIISHRPDELEPRPLFDRRLGLTLAVQDLGIARRDFSTCDWGRRMLAVTASIRAINCNA